MAEIQKGGKTVKHVNNARLPNVELYKTFGVDPRSLKPDRAEPPPLKANIRKLFRIVDEQDAVNSFEWYNLPNGLSGQELERLLYYKGQLCFFYSEALDSFYFMPFALEGTIDFYGRYNTIHPVPMTSGTTEDEKRQAKALSDYLSTLKLKVIKDIKLDWIEPEDLTGSAVILRDYTNQLSQTIIPRQELQDAILDIESDIPCFLRTALKNSTGVQGMRVPDESAYANTWDANAKIDRAAIEGQRMIPIISTLELQDLSGGDVLKAEEYLESLQALDNLRLGFHGISNGGLFQKKAHMLQAEQDMNASSANSALQDRLYNRQHFCDIVNSYTGLGIWCEPKEPAINADVDGDGLILSNESELMPEPEGGEEATGYDGE